jgi:hypothetical protein
MLRASRQLKQAKADKLARSEPAQTQDIAKCTVPPNGGAVTNVTRTAESAVLASLEAISARHPLRMARFLEEKLSQAIERDTLPVPETWRDANTADSMLRRTLGLDRPDAGAAVHVNVSMWSPPDGAGLTDQGLDAIDVQFDQLSPPDSEDE